VLVVVYDCTQNPVKGPGGDDIDADTDPSHQV